MYLCFIVRVTLLKFMMKIKEIQNSTVHAVIYFYYISRNNTFFSPLVLYGCETWSFPVGKNRNWKYKNRVLRRVFGSLISGLTVECKKLCNEYFHSLYASHGIKKRLRLAIHEALWIRQEIHIKVLLLIAERLHAGQYTNGAVP